MDFIECVVHLCGLLIVVVGVTAQIIYDKCCKED
jgi:hypothetical protein